MIKIIECNRPKGIFIEIGGEESNRRLYKRHVLEGKSHKGLVTDEPINIENSNVTYGVYKKL